MAAPNTAALAAQVLHKLHWPMSKCVMHTKHCRMSLRTISISTIQYCTIPNPAFKLPTPLEENVQKNFVYAENHEKSVGTNYSDSVMDEKYLKLYEGIKQHQLKPALPTKSANLAVYVNESETLSNLVKIGVDLSKVEKNREAADYILKMDFQTDVKPYLTFLHDIGIKGEKIGAVITKNPAILMEDLDILKARIDYLQSKRFMKKQISEMISRVPEIISITTKNLDKQLGYIQREFQLSGNEVRQAVSWYPRLAIHSTYHIGLNKLTMNDMLGFSAKEQKTFLMEFPRLYVSGQRTISERFDYLHNVMKLSHEMIVNWPRILGTRTSIIRQRFLFLKHTGRDQFDSTKPNFVSTKMLATGSDVEFCENVAKTSVTEFNEFLKTL